MKKQLITICFALIALLGFSQSTVTVTGVVTGAGDGEPLIGAAVKVVDGPQSTTTDIDGNYKLVNVPNNAKLEVSYIGFENQIVPVEGRTQIDVMLRETSAQLEELVVIGYGVVKKSDLTSSISTVKSDQITEVTTGNAMDALQGKVNGVQIASGGGPGTTPKVIIRGVTTVNGSDPLYVVDGMPVGNNINFLNTNDIESMEVLKDASATAIYGTRGSNGVILITTKKGREGKTNVSFTASIGFQTLKKPKMAQAEEYQAVFMQRYANDGRVAPWNGPEKVSNADGVDWWNEVVNKTALIQNYALGVSGGTDKITYNFSLGYFRNNSQYDFGHWEKINMRLNVDWNFCKQVQLGVEMAPTVEMWKDTPGLFSAAMGMDPTTPIYKNNDPKQGYERSHNNQEWNPVATLNRAIDANNRSTQFALLLTPYLQIQPIKQLVARTQFGANARFLRTDTYSPLFYIDALEKSDYEAVARTPNRYLDWNWTNTVTYSDTFAEKHNLTVMAGFTAERYATYNLWGQRRDLPGVSELLREVSAGTGEQEATGSTAYNTLASVLGRVMYNFNGKYYVTATVRADGSSKFPAGNKWATFPSVSLAWRITQESFMKDVTWLNDWKLRLGWGKVGNQAIPDNSYLSTLGTSDYVFGGTRFPGVVVGSVGNAKLKWETVEDYDIGMDFLLFNSRLNVTADFYVKKSHDMLYAKQNILASGFPAWNAALMANIGSMKATGWELSINWRDQVNDFRYDIGVQLSGVKNRAIKFTGDGPIYDGSGMAESITRSDDDSPIGRFYGYKCEGIFQSWSQIYAHSDEHGNLVQPNAKPGDLIFADLNHDGQLTDADKTFIGSPYPDVMLGLNMSFGWRDFDFIANFYGTFGNDIFNLTKSRYSGTAGANVYAGTIDAVWSESNRNAQYPRLTASDINQNYTRVSSFFVEDGSYFRCKLLTLGYTLPKSITRNTSIRFSVSAQNPFTITKYSGLDPERPMRDGGVLATGIDYNNYQTPKTFLFGIDFKF